MDELLEPAIVLWAIGLSPRRHEGLVGFLIFGLAILSFLLILGSKGADRLGMLYLFEILILLGIHVWLPSAWRR